MRGSRKSKKGLRHASKRIWRARRVPDIKPGRYVDVADLVLLGTPVLIE